MKLNKKQVLKEFKELFELIKQTFSFKDITLKPKLVLSPVRVKRKKKR